MITGVGTRCLEVVSTIDPRCGGVSASLPLLAKAVASDGRHQVTILVVHSSGDASAAHPVEEVPVLAIPVRRGECLYDGPASSRIREHLAAADLVHIHGLWEPHCAIATRWARRLAKPYLISAHGMLETWALRNHWWKKLPYLFMIERRNLRRAACARALTRNEVADYRGYGLTGPIAVIPHGVEIPTRIDPAPFFERFPGLRGRRLVLFLSRIHPKKGPDILCRAWARISPRFPEAHLVLAGPDFEGTRKPIEHLIGHLGISEHITFTGMLNGDLKWSALAAAEVFVLPSHSEGLPVAVLEAMGAGKPVIVTRQCNLPEVADARSGIVIEPDVQHLELALAELLRTPQEDSRQIGERGCRLVHSRYTWKAVGRQLASVYDWILGGPEPDGVQVFPGKCSWVPSRPQGVIR